MKLKDKLSARAKKLKTDIPAIFIALRKKETPISAKILAGLTIVYALSPIDLIPDFIPVLGYLDDLLILPALAAVTIKLIPIDILEECRVEAENIWANGKPKKWYFALPLILFWIIILIIIYRLVRGD